MRLTLLALLLLLACSPPPAPTPSPSSSPSATQTPSASPSVTVEPPPANESLEDYARRIQGRHSYGVYMAGKKAGWALMSFQLESRQGRQVLVFRENFSMRITFMGQKSSLDSKAETVYALDGKGEIVSAQETEDEDGNRTETRVKPVASEYEVSTTSQGRVTRRKVRVERDNLEHARQFERWLRTARAGDKFEQYSASWDEDPVETADEVILEGRESILWGGVRTALYRTTIVHDGGRMDALLQADGTPWKATVGGVIELRAEEEELARRMDVPVDMLEITALRIDRPLDKDDLEQLELEVEGADGFKLPASHRQKAAIRQGKTVWTLKRDFRVKDKQAISAAERKENLKATPELEQDEVIKKLARKIAGPGTPVEQANRLQDWLYKNLEKSYSRNARTARDVLANKAGDCTEHARLFVALARSLGIPAREVGGLVSPQSEPMFAWHAWAEIHDGHQWVSVDPMWNEVYVDATHLKMSQGNRDFSWINVAGSLKLKVLD
ncbi:transglutaminase domain-containing protein [bacterium CPR1]|nr:transglutaminase domain-containing protein [bacterium CPR1]